ncbi:Hypothetical predicted protein [Octopus vulgaris]|uniref:Uncharacterized protein n=1 Tax=Octopus vulgaris TaxID=6645 RepID=A0AA36F9Q2_OCTVU|nr:Hypothetical predicted protein [Octopus vulgaris]
MEFRQWNSGNSDIKVNMFGAIVDTFGGGTDTTSATLTWPFSLWLNILIYRTSVEKKLNSQKLLKPVS